jgi:hypothetical protein
VVGDLRSASSSAQFAGVSKAEVLVFWFFVLKLRQIRKRNIFHIMGSMF